VSFSIGTDTAGSGRVPAALCGVVGLKPSRGLVSTLGIVPACPSLDCPSVFAATVADASAVLDVIAGREEADPWSRHLAPTTAVPRRIGVPRGLDDASFAAAVARVERTGVTLVPVDPDPFVAAGRLLYEAWVAERWTGLGDFVTAHPDSVHPVTRRVLTSATTYTAADAFAAMHRLQALRAATAPVWDTVDAIVFPTVPRTYTLDEVAADPVGTNAHLGRYTQFANLLDLAGIAVPAGSTPAGLPYGVQFLAPAGHDRALAALATRFEERDDVLLAVVGAHRTGQPLHPELVACGAEPVGPVWTAKSYRLFALDDGRPGLVRVTSDGAAVEVELHRIPAAGVGTLLAGIPAPLGLGRIELADGRSVTGFLAESYAVAGAEDITGYGSWPAYLGAQVNFGSAR
jgi:allophanate hydrolase